MLEPLGLTRQLPLLQQCLWLCSPHEVIDAKHKGNKARFINHSCQPNCETQKWLIDGETSVCIFSLCDISVGEELTYDYHLQSGGGKRVRSASLN